MIDRTIGTGPNAVTFELQAPAQVNFFEVSKEGFV
jgi:hypothetical protein